MSALPSVIPQKPVYLFCEGTTAGDPGEQPGRESIRDHAQQRELGRGARRGGGGGVHVYFALAEVILEAELVEFLRIYAAMQFEL